MGNLLGSHAVENERADLNKCPDCECFFAGDTCPMCGKSCPEEMRAGVRKPKKIKQYKGGSDRVTFVQWYHSWWFIVLMMLFMPVVGLILLITSPHKKSHKIIFVVIALVYTVLSFIGIGNIIGYVAGRFEDPVDSSLTREEYISKCEQIDSETYFRTGNGMDGDFVSVHLKIIGGVTNWDKTNSKYPTYYLCSAPGGSEYRIIIRDCLQDRELNFIPGDIICVYGQSAKVATVFDEEYTEHTVPCINAAYVEFLPNVQFEH